MSGGGEGRQEYSEEHFTSELESIMTSRPPAFREIVRSYRVQPTDVLTLNVEVSLPWSDFYLSIFVVFREAVGPSKSWLNYNIYNADYCINNN